MTGHPQEPADRNSTIPLPAVALPAAGLPDVAGPAQPGRPPRATRTLETTAGLLSAGALVLGMVLVVARFAAPVLINGSGVSATRGPATARIVVQFTAGLVGELLHWNRARLPGSIRAPIAFTLIAVQLAALWWCWWR